MIERQYTLKELRARKNKTQSQVAKDIGVSTPTYCSWEKDLSNVPIGKCIALANYYKVSLCELKIC